MRELLMAFFIVGLLLPGTAGARTRLRGVDWANRNYGRRLHLRNGRYVMRRYKSHRIRRAGGCLHTTTSARLGQVRYGDLTGDGRPEAVVEIYTYANYCRGYRLKQRVLIAFAWRQGAAVELGRVALDGVVSVRLANRSLHVRQRLARGAQWVTCNGRWRLKGKKLIRHSQLCKP